MVKVIRLCGGLGNQLFEYALGLYVADITKDEVLFDTKSFELAPFVTDQVHIRYVLDNFNAKIKEAPMSLMSDVMHIPFVKFGSNMEIPKGHICFLDPYGSFESVEKTVQDYKDKDVFFRHYATTEGYCKKYRKILQKDLTLKEELSPENKDMLAKIKSTNSVSVNIRRGDYLRYRMDIDIIYQQRAIEYIKEKVKDPHFFIFSNDPDWVKENLKIDSPTTYVNINDTINGHFDFELIKNCKHNIIANSTFSWWAAWLNDNKEKIVCAPDPWIKALPSLNGTYEHTIPEGWVRIKSTIDKVVKIPRINFSFG